MSKMPIITEVPKCETTQEGTEYFLSSGWFHRIDGPAKINASGDQWWLYNGRYHRENGPFYISSKCDISWALNDVQLTFDEYCSRLKQDYGKTDKDIEALVTMRDSFDVLREKYNEVDRIMVAIDVRKHQLGIVEFDEHEGELH